MFYNSKWTMVIGALVLSLIMIVGCGGSGSNETKTSKAIGPDGGTIVSADKRISLSIPQGALDAETEIIIEKRKVSEAPAVFDGLPLAEYYELLPEGLHFNRDINLTYTLQANPVVSDTNFSVSVPLILTQEGNTTKLLDFNVSIDGEKKVAKVHAVTSHFSPYVTTVSSLGFRYQIDVFIPGTVTVNDPQTSRHEYAIRNLYGEDFKDTSHLKVDVWYATHNFVDRSTDQYMFLSQESESHEGIYDSVLYSNYVCLAEGTQKFAATLESAYYMDAVSVKNWDPDLEDYVTSLEEELVETTMRVFFTKQIRCISQSSSGSSESYSSISDGGSASSASSSVGAEVGVSLGLGVTHYSGYSVICYKIDVSDFSNGYVSVSVNDAEVFFDEIDQYGLAENHTIFAYGNYKFDVTIYDTDGTTVLASTTKSIVVDSAEVPCPQ